MVFSSRNPWLPSRREGVEESSDGVGGSVGGKDGRDDPDPGGAGAADVYDALRGDPPDGEHRDPDGRRDLRECIEPLRGAVLTLGWRVVHGPEDQEPSTGALALERARRIVDRDAEGEPRRVRREMDLLLRQVNP